MFFSVSLFIFAFSLVILDVIGIAHLRETFNFLNNLRRLSISLGNTEYLSME